MFHLSRLEWKPLIESNVALGVNSGKWSREEQLLWERQRVAACGIASYELHPSGRVLFPCSSSLFACDEGEGGQVSETDKCNIFSQLGPDSGGLWEASVNSTKLVGHKWLGCAKSSCYARGNA